MTPRNRATAVVCMVVANESRLYFAWRARGKDARTLARFQAGNDVALFERRAETLLADTLHDTFAETERPSGLWGELISFALGEVDWREVARDILSGIEPD